METQSRTPVSSERRRKLTKIEETFLKLWSAEGRTADEMLGRFSPALRPAASRYLAKHGLQLRSEFRSDGEAEAFWAHVGEDAAIERANLGEHGMTQVPDPCCCRVHAGAGNRCPDCPQHSGE